MGNGGLIFSGVVIGKLGIIEVGLLSVGLNVLYYIPLLIHMLLEYRLKYLELKADLERRKNEQIYNQSVEKKWVMEFELRKKQMEQEHEYRMKALEYGKGPIEISESKNTIAELDSGKPEADSLNKNIDVNGSNGNEPGETIHRIK